MGVNADGKINLSVGIDEGQIKQSASQIKSILKKEISTINLDQFFDDKKIQQEVQQTIDSINKTLSKSKFKRVDFSSLIPKVDSIMSNTKISEKQRSNIVSGFGHQFEALDKYANKDIIPLLSNSKVFEDYLNDLTNIVDFIKSIKGLSTKEQDRMIKDLSKADASDIETAFTLKDIEKKYGANIKYKIKPKDIVPLLQKSIENMDVTDEGQLKDFLGVYNRGKYLAQMDTSKSGVFRTFFEQFQKQHHQELEAFRTQYPDLFAKMEREVIGMSKDFDTLYNAKYKNKSLDTTDLVKGLKINKTASQIHNAQAEKAPTTPQELTDTVLSVQSDVKEIDEKVEKAEQLANEAKEAANEVKKEINNTNKNKTNATNIEKKDLKDSKQKNEQQSFPALEQAKEEIDNAIETEKTTLEKLQQERSQLETEKEINESVKAKLEKRNETINKVIKNNFKDESKKGNYDNLKKQHDNYKNKKEINDKAWEELDSLEQFSPEWKTQLSKAQQSKEEEEKAWVKYYKAFDIAKNGKNNVAKSRLDKFDPKNEGLTEFDNKTFEIYIQSLKEAMARNKEVIDDCEKELEDYRKKKEELDKKINELSKDNNITNNNTSPSSNKSNEKKTSKPKISIDLQQELEAAFGFDFNDTDESSDITSTAQAEKDLQENTNGANKALEEQKNITEGIVKTAETLVYHMGQINGDKTVLSNIFGSEIQNPNGHNIGTGLYTTKTPKEYTKPVLSNEDLDNYYAIDTSELKMYEAHAEETAKEFYDFIHRLEQFCIMMGSGFEGFDDNLENIDEEALYSTAQKIFPNLEAFFNDFDEFDEYINEMITLVSKSGIGADGTINPIKMRLFQKEFGTDDIKTRFLKQLGYQGVDLSGTSFGKQLGNIVFNPLDNSKILSSGKDINQVVKEVVDKIGQSQKNESKTSESLKGKNDSTSTKKAIAEQEELEEKTKKATDALKDQQQTLAQTNVESPSQNLPEEGTKKDDVEKNKTKPKAKTSARVKKPVKSADENEIKPDSNGVTQSEADSANGANNEASGFKLIAGSAEEAAEAKKKFVEANKEVLQSIVASKPKIEQEAKALGKIEEVPNKIKTTKETKSQEGTSKTTGRKGYFDFEAMPNDLIEQRYAEISPFPVTPKGISLATDRLNDEVHTAMDSVELLEELHTAWDRSQQEIKDIIYDSTIENMQEEYAESQRPVYDFEPDYEDLARQAQEAREYYEEQISNDFEVKAEAKFNLKEDETGQLSLFDDVLPEKNWGQEIIQATDDISKAAVKGQISLQDLEEAEQRVTAQYAKLRSNKDFLQGEDVSEKFLESYEGISTEKTQELFKTIQELKQVKASLQDSFDKKGNLIGDPLQVEDTYNTYIKLIDIVKRLKTEITGQYSEETAALKLKQDAEKAEEELEQLRTNIEQTFAKISSSKEFIQGKSLNADYISKFGVFDNTKNLEKLSRYFAYLEKTKSELSSSFDRQGQLIGDPIEVENLINQYNTLIEEIKKIKLEIESPHSEENIILQMLKDSKKLKESLENLYPKLPSLEKITPSVDKVLQPFREMNLPVTESRGQLLDSVKRMQEINSELSSSFDAQGKLIGSPKRVQELILEYKNLIKQVDDLKAKISSPMSEENIALKLAKDAEKAEKQLDELKGKVDKTLGKSNLFEAQTQKTINTYGAFEGNGEGQRTELINPEALPTRFKEQQEQVQNLVNELEKYKKAIEELRTLRASDDATLEQLTEADNKVKALKESISNLSGEIKTSGIANASEEQIGALKNKIESFLNNTPNLTKDVRAQLQDYIKVLDSGASVSKTRYASMTADLNKFKAAQASGSTIWEQMVGKMREGIAFLATKFSFYQIFNQFRQGFQVIRQFDDALTEMMKVSDETRTSLEKYQKTTFDTADAIGSNALQIQNSTADFMRLGETLNQAAESAKSANVLMNVSEFQSIDEATKSLIAMSAAYNDLSKMNIIDKLNEVGNNYAISTSEAATALQSSASALKTAGNDIDEALALITAGNAVVQDANKVGIKDAQR